MVTEINFYQADETLIKSLAPLLLKILDEKKKVLLLCQNQQIKAIDDALWSYGRNKFIPHITISDKNFVLDRQPILISDREENSNNADYLVMITDASEAFISAFPRAFYFFEEADYKKAENFAKKLKPTNCYKKSEGKWVKFSF